MTKAGLYVYAIIPAEAKTENKLGTGIDAERLRVVTGGSVAAVVHASETEPYQGPDSHVERWILEHSQVVDAAWEAAGTVLPVSFNVIVNPGESETAENRLTQWLAGISDTASEHLGQLRDRVELRVEITLDESVVASNSPELVEMRQTTEARPAGVQRLYRKRFEERTREIAERAADQLYTAYRPRLAALAEDLVENSRPGRNPGSVGVLTVSLLVHRFTMDSVGVELADIRDSQPGVQIRYLGPWPPYSFADVPEVDSSAP